ncbi:MAG TPA: PDDEXK nuclease domain-containing protein [Bacteroides graminisolvens]|jgi:predicted nuclease of restriction endonuclease-like (RecB) superfamily|nr:PDDEXK nuclease domain-containing protein [Bacteroides graminisolvens]
MDTKPTFVKRGDFFDNEQYRQWFVEIKQRLQTAQIKAAVKVNTTMLEFYWSLGRDIVDMKAEATWGSGVIKQLSLDLKDAYPSLKGLSYTNLKYASQWYRFYSEDISIRQQLVGEIGMPEKFGFIPWGHHIQIMSKSKTVNEASFYLNQVIEGNWSRRRLEDELATNLYERQGGAITNFEDHLPKPQSELAKEILKDPYNFDFLSLTQGYNEKQFEEALAQNVTRFLLELGKGFAFVGRQMELRMPSGQSFFPDMVFYHTKLKCYVIVELKVVDFIPEFAGKLNFYVSAADHLLRDENDNPSIGLLICKSKDETIVKWSFQDINKPMGVAAYENELLEVMNKTIADKLPTPEDIERIIE